MSTADDLRELVRQSRERIADVELLRAEHLSIQRGSRRCLEQTRVLLARSARRAARGEGAACD